jgi:hypothetical protein
MTFLGPALSTFDSPSGHHSAGIPKSKGERSNPTKRAGKLGTATNDPKKKVKASAFMIQRDVSKEEIEAPYRPIQDVPVPSPTKPTFTTRHTHANEGILTQLTSELVAMHIGQNTHKSATMLGFGFVVCHTVLSYYISTLLLCIKPNLSHATIACTVIMYYYKYTVLFPTGN